MKIIGYRIVATRWKIMKKIEILLLRDYRNYRGSYRWDWDLEYGEILKKEGLITWKNSTELVNLALEHLTSKPYCRSKIKSLSEQELNEFRLNKKKIAQFIEHIFIHNFSREKDIYTAWEARELFRIVKVLNLPCDLIKLTKIYPKDLTNDLQVKLEGDLLGYDVAQDGPDWWSAIYTAGFHPGLIEKYSKEELKLYPFIKKYRDLLNKNYLFKNPGDALGYRNIYHKKMPYPEKDVKLYVIQVELLDSYEA